jgi:hypothetical protein
MPDLTNYTPELAGIIEKTLYALRVKGYSINAMRLAVRMCVDNDHNIRLQFGDLKLNDPPKVGTTLSDIKYFNMIVDVANCTYTPSESGNHAQECLEACLEIEKANLESLSDKNADFNPRNYDFIIDRKIVSVSEKKHNPT